MSEQPGLVSEEGVDEGSAASTVEGRSTGSDDVQGPAPHGRPAGEADPAAPDDVRTSDLRADGTAGPGQELAAGEG